MLYTSSRLRWLVPCLFVEPAAYALLFNAAANKKTKVATKPPAAAPTAPTKQSKVGSASQTTDSAAGAELRRADTSGRSDEPFDDSSAGPSGWESQWPIYPVWPQANKLAGMPLGPQRLAVPNYKIPQQVVAHINDQCTGNAPKIPTGADCSKMGFQLTQVDPYNKQPCQYGSDVRCWLKSSNTALKAAAKAVGVPAKTWVPTAQQPFTEGHELFYLERLHFDMDEKLGMTFVGPPIARRVSKTHGAGLQLQGQPIISHPDRPNEKRTMQKNECRIDETTDNNSPNTKSATYPHHFSTFSKVTDKECPHFTVRVESTDNNVKKEARTFYLVDVSQCPAPGNKGTNKNVKSKIPNKSNGAKNSNTTGMSKYIPAFGLNGENWKNPERLPHWTFMEKEANCSGVSIDPMDVAPSKTDGRRNLEPVAKVQLKILHDHLAFMMQLESKQRGCLMVSPEMLKKAASPLSLNGNVMPLGVTSDRLAKIPGVGLNPWVWPQDRPLDGTVEAGVKVNPGHPRM